MNPLVRRQTSGGLESPVTRVPMELLRRFDVFGDEHLHRLDPQGPAVDRSSPIEASSAWRTPYSPPNSSPG
jgi:hypothetical protein